MILMLQIMVISLVSSNFVQANTIEATVRTYKLQLFENGKTYVDAERLCEESDSWLVEITDEEIQNAVLAMKNSHSVWIGLKYAENTWKWKDGSSMRYSDWKGGNEPTFASNEDSCIIMSLGADARNKGTWDKYSCTSDQRYVCQTDKNYLASYQLRFVREKSDFANIAKKCYANDLASHPVAIKSPRQNSLVTELLKSQTVSYVWTSGNSTAAENIWKWGDGTPVPRNWNPSPWAQNRPGTGVECLAITKTDNKWLDMDCNRLQEYICQKNMTKQCIENICVNSETCAIPGSRYECTCLPGYFGTNCEKELISLSTAETIHLKKGQELTVTIAVKSYDGKVDIERRGEQGVPKVKSSDKLSDSLQFLLGTQLTSKTYHFVATPQAPLETKTYTKTIDIAVIIKDQCDSSPCANGASCTYSTTSPYFTCTCNNKAYDGAQCKDLKFVVNGNCKYHVYFGKPKKSFSAVNATCTKLRGALAMLKTVTVQDLIEQQFIEQYGNNESKYYELWIGGQNISNMWYWLDGTKISSTDERWIQNKMQLLHLSTWRSSSTSNMQWYSKSNEGKASGYVCEISVNAPCTGVDCLNGGTCVTVGCQANCKCINGFDGKRCGNNLVTITPHLNHFTIEVGNTVDVSLATTSRDRLVKIALYNDSSSILISNKTAKTLNQTITFTIGPFKHQAHSDSYSFRATPHSGKPEYTRTVTVRIRVEGPPSLKINSSLLTLPSSAKKSIKCSSEGVPSPVVYWQKYNINITTEASATTYQEKDGSTATLHFSRTATRNEVGNYTCYAKNSVLGRVKMAKRSLPVEASVKLMNSSKHLPVSSFELATFACTFEAYPEPNIRWKWGDDVNGAKYIQRNEEGSIFKFESVNEKTTLLFQKTSTLSVTLVEYMEKTTIFCEAIDSHGNKSVQSFYLNRNLVIDGNNSYHIYDETARNYTDAESFCKAGSRRLAKVMREESHQLLKNKMKSISVFKLFIGAQRQEEKGVKLWKWEDGEFLYNETKNGRYNNQSTGIVDGKFVAWKNDEPRGYDKNCLMMINESSLWRWSAAECSMASGFICERAVAGIPKHFKVSVDQCSADIIVSWETAPEAIGVTHRIYLSEVNNLKNNKSEMAIPKDGATIIKTFRNQGNSKTYNVKITICPECPRPYGISKSVTTAAPVSAANLTFFAANVNRVNSTCQLSWSMNSSSEGIIAFKILSHSSLVHVIPKTDLRWPNISKQNITSTSRQYVPNTQPNRNYTFHISAVTCLNTGGAFEFEGECITEVAAPWIVPRSIVSSALNEDETLTIQVKIPDQSNGPLGCIFVIVVYKPIDSNETSPKYEKEDLQRAMTNSVAASLNPGDSYIALAIKRSEILNVAGDFLTRKLGDEGESTCDINEQNQNRKKRSTENDGKITAKNRKLEDETDYNLFTVTTTPDVGVVHFQSSVTSSFKKPEKWKIASGTIAGILVAILILVIAAAVVVTLYKKKKRVLQKSESYEINDGVRMTELEEANVNNDPVYINLGMEKRQPRSETDIPMQQLQTVYKAMVAGENLEFLQEFEELKEKEKVLEYPTEIALHPVNKKKNRYINILPSDKSRVVLGTNEEGGYINACYIDGYKKVQKFIATQGPLPSTVDDFWRMIVEQKCTSVVMLTNCKENKKVKCEKYWPDVHTSQSFNGVKVRNIKEANMGSFQVRTFHVKMETEELTVKQLHFQSWPDHGVPATTTNIVRFHTFVNELQSKAPIVVHCSAGAGRTGAYIAYDFLLEEAEFLASVDVHNCVLNLRKQRVDMVQNCDQYILVHKLLLEYHLFGTTDRSGEQILNILSDATSLKKEFDNLAVVPKTNRVKHLDEAKNRAFNRDQDIVPYEQSRVFIAMKNGEATMPYINASNVGTYDNTTKLIAAQAPMSNSVDTFWRAVVDNNVNTIIMLTACMEGDKEQSLRYWPSKVEEVMNVNYLAVKVQSSQTSGHLTVREIEVTGDVKKIVTQYQYTGWSSDQCPTDPKDVVQLVGRVHSVAQGNERPGVMVVCGDGAGRTGTFCAIVNLIKRVKVENKVDVFRTVKDLRDYRPKMVQNLDQYRFCYEAVSHYLNSFDLHSSIDDAENAKKEDIIYENL